MLRRPSSGKLKVARTSCSSPDHPALHELDELGRLRAVPPHEGLHQDAAGPLGGRERLLRVLGAARERLLAEDVLARGEGPHRPLDVEGVREGDVDGVHLGVLDQRLVASVRALDAVLDGVRLGPACIAARHGDDLGAIRLLRCRQQPAVDPRGRDEPEADRLAQAQSSRATAR